MAEPDEIEVGDAVQLRTGGPLMVVEARPDGTEGPPDVKCAWFGPDGELRRERFDPRTLAADMDDVADRLRALDRGRA